MLRAISRNALARAVFFHRLGEIRDQTLENQRYRASGLNLAVAAVILWNTVYIDRAVAELRSRGEVVPDELIAHVAPTGLGAHRLQWRLHLADKNHSKMAFVPSEIRAQHSSTRLSVKFGEDSAMTPRTSST
jgi:hypothetical protein